LRDIIENSLKATPGDRIIFLGDYIDRGSHSKEVIDYIISLKEKHFDIITLKGNHEAMLLDALETGDSTLWFWNGGYETVKSFNIDLIYDLDKKYVSFFNNLAWYHEEGKYLFVHAGFNDTLKDPFSDRMSMIWIRKEDYKNPVLAGRVIIHGHTPITVEECRRNLLSSKKVINIDTGCVYKEAGMRKLTAIELNSGKLFSV
ncbi:MAG: metallophosphoesterase family protein, partial [Methanosarcina sp.]